MSYVPAKIVFEFNQSSYEQVEPSTVSMDCNFKVIGNYEEKNLSVYEQMRFLRMCLERIVDKMNLIAYEDGLTKENK
jgi:hypothetical protein